MKMKTKRKEEEEEEDEEFEVEDVVVGQIPTVSVPRHIKKRSLKNKALSVSFNEKDLTDYVTGFHKRKKKRRKEAQKQLKEKDRIKRIQARKRRKAEKELALYGEASESQPAPGSEPDDLSRDDGELDLNTSASISETKTYESGFTTITVTTSELSHEDDDLRPIQSIPLQSSAIEKNHILNVKQKPLKRTGTQKAHKKAGKAGLRSSRRKNVRN